MDNIITLSLQSGDRVYKVELVLKRDDFSEGDIWEWLQSFGMPGLGFKGETK